MPHGAPDPRLEQLLPPEPEFRLSPLSQHTMPDPDPPSCALIPSCFRVPAFVYVVLSTQNVWCNVSAKTLSSFDSWAHLPLLAKPHKLSLTYIPGTVPLSCILATDHTDSSPCLPSLVAAVCPPTTWSLPSSQTLPWGSPESYWMNTLVLVFVGQEAVDAAITDWLGNTGTFLV